MNHASVVGSRALFACTGALTLAAALVLGAVAIPSPVARPQPSHAHGALRGFPYTTPIHHVIVIVQENRSVDNLFNGWSSKGGNADTVTSDPVTHLALQPCSLYELAQGCPPTSGPSPYPNSQCDLSHKHEPNNPSNPGGFSTEYDLGLMDGFQSQTGDHCSLVNGENPAFSFVPPTETTQYWGFASQYAFVNHALQANSGPSFPAHQYLIAGQAAGMLGNGDIVPSDPWSIDENETANSHHSCLHPNALATGVDLSSAFPGIEGPNVTDCNSYKTIFDALPAAGNAPSWKYYTNNEDGLWGGPSAVSQDCKGISASGKTCNNQSIINCSPQALMDFINNASVPLASVTYVIPKGSWSDHPTSVSPGPESGPNWVTLLVDAIGSSPYWSTTTIIVTWDDWGGWFDHYQPPSAQNPNQSIINCATNGTLKTPASCGFRVPMIVIGPYVKNGYVDTTPTNAAGSILLYIEHTFGISQPLTGTRGSGALGSADTWTTDDLMNTMDFTGAPHPFVPEPTSTPASWYLGQSCTDPSIRIR